MYTYNSIHLMGFYVQWNKEKVKNVQLIENFTENSGDRGK